MEINPDILGHAYHVLMRLWILRLTFIILVTSPFLTDYIQQEKRINESRNSATFKGLISIIIILFIIYVFPMSMLAIDSMHIFNSSSEYIRSISCHVHSKGLIYPQIIRQNGIHCSDNQLFPYKDFFDFPSKSSDLNEGENYIIYYLPKTKMIVYSKRSSGRVTLVD